MSRIKPKYRVMLDGSRVGARLENELEVNDVEADRIRKILRAASGKDLNPENNELTINVSSLGKMRMTLRKHREHTSWFLNIDGNPLMFLTGRNVYGWPEAHTQIRSVFKRCIVGVEETASEKTGREWKFPDRVSEMIAEMNINVNHLEFATYTGRLENKQKILNAWRYMFGRTTRKKDKMMETLGEMLGVEVMSNYRNSFGVATVNSQGKAKVMFTAYDKQKQLQDKDAEDAGSEGISIDVVAPEWTRAMDYRDEERIPEDIHDRLRLEIAFASVWFRDNHIKTLADLENYVQRRHEGQWGDFVITEVQKIMKRARLIEMWSFDATPVLEAAEKDLDHVPGFDPRIKTGVWLAMLEARAEMELLTNKMQLAKLKGDPKYTEALLEGVKALPMRELKRLRPDPSQVEAA